MTKTMSKIKYLILVTLFAVASIFAIGCKEVKVTGISVDEGYKATAYLNEDYDFSNIKITVQLDNDKTEKKSCEAGWVYEGDELVSEDFTQIPGEHELEVRYKGFTATITIEVFDEEDPEKDKVYQIKYFEDPQFVQDFRDNTTGANKKLNAVNSQAELLAGNKVGFNDLSAKYVVGDDNAFVYTPKMRAVENHVIKPITEYKTSTEIYIKDQGQYVKLDEDTIPTYVAIDDDANTYDFTETAIGKEFKIIVKPYFYNESEADIIGEGSDFEFKVVDGWNAYSIEDLKLFNNIDTIEDKSHLGDSKKYINGKWNPSEEDKTLSASMDGLILHRDINITFSDLPAYFKEGDNVRDENGIDGWIFAREIGEGEVFNIEGNYFQISAKDLPAILHEDGKEAPDPGTPVVTHLVLFGFRGKVDNGQGQIIQYTNVPKYTIRNVEFIGNSQASANDSNWGGISTFKAGGADLTINNCAFSRWYMAMMYETEKEFDDVNDVRFEVFNTNVCDVSNTLVYLWGAEDAYFENSKFIGSAGPVIITDHVYTDEQEDNFNKTGNINPFTQGWKTNLVVKDCKFESWLAGDEPWFASFTGADLLVLKFKALDTFLNQLGVSMLKDGDYLNVIGLYKCGNVQGISAIPINSSFDDISEEASERLYPNGLDFAMVMESDFADEYQSADPVIASSNGFLATVNEETKVPQIKPGTSLPTADDYLYVYYGGITLVLDLIPYTQPTT